MNVHGWNKWFVLFGSRRGAITTLSAWLLLLVALAVASPGAKQYAVSAGEGGADGANPAAVAQRVLEERFPQSEGLAALLVFHGDGALDGEKLGIIAEFSRWLESEGKSSGVKSSIPYYALPEQERSRLVSQDGTTLLLSAELQPDLDSDRTLEAMEAIRAYWERHGAEGVRLETTGPAAISADTLTLFRNADFVLMIATVALILVLLVAIYRSPLLAVIPLAIAGIVYSVVDKLLGVAGRAGWFVIDKQSLSIMMILLFAVVTDYCLFVFSRYRERLAAGGSKYEAMGEAMARVAEPILFSGGTILASMLALFAAIFQPYRGFAPVFAIAVAVILLAGLTLIPAVFAIAGRKAFWPFVPKTAPGGKGASIGAERANAKRRIPLWERTGRFVTRKPKTIAATLFALLALASLNIGSQQYSFNLMKSFPADTPSRVGFELLESRFPPGELAPVSLILEGGESLAGDAEVESKLAAFAEELQKGGGAVGISAGEWSEDKGAVRLRAVMNSNPYEAEALNRIDRWREEGPRLLERSGFDWKSVKLHIAGQTAEQADVRTMNERDTIVLFASVSLLIGLMLTAQTRSWKMSLLMLTTIVLSFAATLGLTWTVFHGLLGYETFSYRMPVYTFVFMVALGVDYNIMLVSRIREEAEHYPWKEAVSRGVAFTGGVISSAGLILAATFGVLITQPMQELYLFGFAMTVGILIDTFLVRGMLLPSILTVVFRNGKKSSASSPNRSDKPIPMANK